MGSQQVDFDPLVPKRLGTISKKEPKKPKNLTLRESTNKVDYDPYLMPNSPNFMPEASEPTSSRDVGLVMQIFPSLLLGMIGCVLAGWLLDTVKTWEIFTRISKLFILVPTLLNLKGNLEMNLAARLSTSANLGDLDVPKNRRQIILGNLAVLQMQAISIGFIAGLFSILLGYIARTSSNGISELMLLITSSVVCASLSSLILGILMCGVIVLSRKFHINPDNIATPLAAGLGDILTLSLLIFFGQVFMQYLHTPACTIVLCVALALLPLWTLMVYRNPFVSDLIYEGWPSIVMAMFVSSFAGVILERFIIPLNGLAMLAPVLNGVSGNIATVCASRYSTALHAAITEPHGHIFSSLFTVNLLLQWLFLSFLKSFGFDHGVISLTVFGIYTAAFCLLATVLLLFARWMSWVLWVRERDPDNYIMPMITSIGDLLGTSLLVGGLVIAQKATI